MTPKRPGLDDLPALVSRADLAALGLGRADVDAVFRALVIVNLPGQRRVYVHRQAFLEYLAASTYADDRVRPIG